MAIWCTGSCADNRVSFGRVLAWHLSVVFWRSQKTIEITELCDKSYARLRKVCVGFGNHEPEAAVRRVRSDPRVKHVESLGWPRPKTSRRLRARSRGQQPIIGERFIPIR